MMKESRKVQNNVRKSTKDVELRLASVAPFCFLSLLFCSAPLHYMSMQILYWYRSLSPPDQVRDAGRILREWQSRGKRPICTAFIVVTHFFTRWHPAYSLTSYHTEALQSVSFSVSHFYTYPYFSSSHDTCPTQHSIVAETSDIPPTLPSEKSVTHLSCFLWLWIVALCHIYIDSLSGNVWQWLWNYLTKMFLSPGGQRHS